MKSKLYLAIFLIGFTNLIFFPMYSGINGINTENASKKELVKNNIKFLSTIDLVILEFINNKFEFESKESKFQNFDAKKRRFFAKFKELNIQMEEININGKMFQHFYLIFNDKNAKDAYLKKELASKMKENFENTIVTDENMIIYETSMIAPEKLTEEFLSIVTNEAFSLYEESYKGGVLSFLDTFLGNEKELTNKYLVDFLIKEK